MSRTNILLIWLGVVVLCVLSSAMAFIVMKDAPNAIKGLITAFAGGGVMAMTLQAIIPEAYEEIKDWLSVIGGCGFAIAFLVSHLFH